MTCGVRVLVCASTFPASDTDSVPAFVRDLLLAVKRAHADVDIDVLAPQVRDETAPFTQHAAFAEHRFPYFLPRRAQALAGHGIVPALQANPALFAQVPFLFGGELVALLRHIRARRPDVLWAHWFTPQGVTAALASMITGVPFVLTSHANDVRVWRKLPLAGQRVVRALLPRASRITAVSDATLAKMRGFFSAAEWEAIAPRVAIIPMGVDVAALAQGSVDRAALKARHDLAGRAVIYFIGRLAEKKGVAHLIDAFARLRRDDAVLVIAGDGPLRAALEAQAVQAGIAARVRFVGYVSGARKTELLQLADVVAVPSIETASGDAEGFPVVVMEALAAGRPLVASDATGADSVLAHGESGFVVPQRDSAALAVALSQCLGLGPAAQEALAQRAQQAARDLDWAVIAERHHAFLLAPFAP